MRIYSTESNIKYLQHPNIHVYKNIILRKGKFHYFCMIEPSVFKAISDPKQMYKQKSGTVIVN